MEGNRKTKLLVITENKSLQDQIHSILSKEDYEIKTFAQQDDAVLESEKEPPELIVSALLSPNVNGLELCRELRKNFLLRYIPIILILTDGQTQETEKLIYAGADDYIQSSAIAQELPIKIKINLYRVARHQDINPLTRLPGQASLVRELQKRIDARSAFAANFADLEAIKDYNQRYGFKKGDEVIKFSASLIFKAIKDFGSPSDFLCHPQNDDFIFLTLTDSVNTMAEWITKEFDRNIRSFYEPEELKRGYLLLKNRKGELQKIPFLKICIGIVTNEFFPFTSPGQIIQVGTELRIFAQSNFPVSSFVKDRRKTYPFH